MSITRSFSVAIALLVGLAVSGYVYAQHLFTRITTRGGPENSCVTNAASAHKENPNEELFISCGGFL